MKVLLFTLEYPPFKGGVANYYGNLADSWPKPDNIFVLHNNEGKLINKTLPFLKWLPAVWRLWSTAKNLKIEHIIVGHLLPLGLAARFYAGLNNITYSVILHGMDFTCAVKTNRKRFMAESVLQNADKIICANSYTAGLVKRSFPKMAQKIIVVNPGVGDYSANNTQHAAALKKKYNLENKIVLLSVGRLIKRKGFDKVLEAMPEVLKKLPNLIYIILGSGEDLQNLKFKISNLKLNNSVKIIADASDEEKNAWYGVVNIFIMPSRNINGDFEGFGIVYLEANLAGKPVIAGKSGGVEDAVADGVNGLMIDPENISDIAQAIIKLALDPDLRQKLGDQGKERAIKEFNWGKQIKQIYNNLV